MSAFVLSACGDRRLALASGPEASSCPQHPDSHGNLHPTYLLTNKGCPTLTSSGSCLCWAWVLPGELGGGRLVGPSASWC